MSKKNNIKKSLSNYSQLSIFNKGETIFNYFDKADKIYFVLKGLIRIYIKNNDNEVEIKRVTKGGIIGETALTAAEYTSRAEAYLESNLLVFKKEKFKKLMAKNNKFAQKIINNLSRYIKKLEDLDNISLQPISTIDKKIAAENKLKKSLTAAKKKENRVKKAELRSQKGNNNNFYLPGHQNFGLTADQGYDYYLYQKEIKCPVCSKIFEVKKIRYSRLRITKINQNLRPIYQNFKLYFYNIWSCPNCYFTAKINDFEDFSQAKRKKINKNFKKLVKQKLGSNFKIEFKEPRNINTVFNAYYLAVKLYNYVDFNEDKKALLWREISWIYDDLAKKELSKRASLKALAHLKNFYFKDKNTQKNKKETDNLILLLAVLFYKHGKEDKALPLLDNLIRDNKVKLRQKRKARDLFLKIREEKKSKNQKH